jgi:hypothetical protein
MASRINVSYLKQDQYTLVNLLSFCDQTDLQSAKFVSASWHHAVERIEALCRERQVKEGRAFWQPQSRHPLYGICQLIDKISAGEPVNPTEIKRRLFFISFFFRRKILNALSLAEGRPFSSQEASHHPFKLKMAIQKTVAKHFADQDPKVQRLVAYRVWKYAGGIREDEEGRKIDPCALGMQHAKVNTSFLIRALNDVQKLEYPSLLCPRTTDASFLLRGIVKSLDRVDENDKFLIDCREQAKNVLDMLQSLPGYLRRKLVVLSCDSNCIIPYNAAYQVLNLGFTFSCPQHKQMLQLYQGVVPRGVIVFDEWEFAVVQTMIPQSSLFETENNYKRRIEGLLIKTFHQCFHRNRALPPCNAFLKQTMLFYVLINHQLTALAPNSLPLLLQNLALLWKQQGIDVLAEMFRSIRGLNRHPKPEITPSNCFDNFKYFEMAFALTVDALFYPKRAPKIAIALDLLTLLDDCFDKTMTHAQKEKIGNKIHVLQRLCKAPCIYNHMRRHIHLPKTDQRTRDILIFNDISTLRKAVEDTLYSLLILEQSGYTYSV